MQMGHRRRKLYKYTKFQQSNNCYDSNSWCEFKFPDKPLIVEMGAGSAEFSLEYARNFPDYQIVAIDKKRDRLWQGARQASEEKLENICFLNASAEVISAHFPSNSIAQFWMTFPDPYFKKNQVKRRMTNKNFLDGYKAVLAPRAQFFLKTDNSMLLASGAESVGNHPDFEIVALETDLPEVGEGPIFYQTKYERLWRDAGLPIGILAAERR
jgi:tRNA (guanine-N7-)-methyltransferase